MSATVKLVKGQRLKLSSLTNSDKFNLNLTISGFQNRVSFYCLALNDRGKLLQPSYLIHPAQPQSPCRSIAIENQTETQVSFTINLASLPPEAKELIFVISMGEQTDSLQETAANIRDGFLTITEGGQELARYSFSAQDFEGEKALVIGKIYHKNLWRLALVSSGFRAGLRALLPHYGVPEDAMPVPAVSRREVAPVVGQNIQTTGRVEAVQIFIPPSWPGGQIPELPQGVTNSVGLILVDNQDGTRSSGTGFIINPGGYLLTCYHVVNEAKTINICMSGTDFIRPVVCLAENAEQDVALLWITDGNGSPYWMLLAPPNDEPKLGDPLGLLGYPLGLDLGLNVSYSQGIINSHRKRGNKPLLQIDAGASSGSSGGPVFRRSDGRVAGILQSGFERHGMLINMAWDIRAFWQLGWHII